MSSNEVKTEAKAAGWGLFWWTIAFLLHAAGVLLVIYFTPLREYLFTPTDPNKALEALRGSRMRQIVKQLLNAHTLYVRKRVGEQTEVLEQLESLLDDRYRRYRESAERERKEGLETPPPEPRSVLGSAPKASSAFSLSGRDFFELYSAAQEIEESTCETYRRIRATELARIQSLTLTEASEATKVPLPQHPEVNRDIFYQDIESGTDPRLQRLKDEILKVRLEVEEMLASAQRMLDTAQGFHAADVLGTSVYGEGGVFSGSGQALWGSSIGPPLSPEEYFPGGTDGNFGRDFAPVPGRKLMTGEGVQAEWMYIDTWWIIGPFPNPNRMNIDKKFPPETVPGSAINLDLSYVGKDGRKLTWEYRQSNTLMVVPHVVTNYAIWYAYTEIYADKPQERWVIFGSDDYSRVWLNGEKIFSSGVTPHMWIPDRGWRKVKFRKGFNRMLLKIENAGGTMGFSVAIFLGDVPTGAGG